MKWVLLSLILLSSCASARTGCLPMKVYSQDEQNTLAVEIAALPPSAALVSAMEDYAAMRAANRACLK